MKPAWQSKTIWLQIITLVIAFITVIGNSELVDPKIVAVLTGLVKPVLDIVLRFVTKDSIKIMK